ncbi:sulfur globule protein precursor [Bradyrhizobium sp.]|uniref:sulfur globule protein precursor n=1 Tax=Bradyrhizobium sp. TaxID=376 RepID=UPI002726C31B|nr:sulfur globule protein precursor [Bradyrhizobium sp.]MDO9296986.1 sulfur globule protein precursor [Bradyrhizobium sp.]
MLRKISFAVITAIALGAAAMSPASAGGGGGHGHGGHGHGGHHGHGHGGHHGHGHHGHRHFYGSSAFYIGGDCYKYIQTRRGLRLVNVCAY